MYNTTRRPSVPDSPVGVWISIFYSPSSAPSVSLLPAHSSQRLEHTRPHPALAGSPDRPPSHPAALRPLELHPPCRPPATAPCISLPPGGIASRPCQICPQVCMHVHRTLTHTHLSRTYAHLPPPPQQSPSLSHTQTHRRAQHTHALHTHVHCTCGRPHTRASTHKLHPPYSLPSKSVDAVPGPAGPTFPVALLPRRKAPHTHPPPMHVKAVLVGARTGSQLS